jgi:hypothetical protein
MAFSTWYLDMDGVIADFMRGLAHAHGRPDPWEANPHESRYNPDEIWGLTPDETYKVVDGEFWKNLPPMPLWPHLLQWAEAFIGLSNVFFLTKPIWFSNAYEGKSVWVQRHAPQALHGKVICTAAKEGLAGPDRLLIDDKDENVHDFINRGGQAILVPRPWNSGRRLARMGEATITDHVRAELTRLGGY